MARKRYRLVVEAGGEIGTVYPLEAKEIYIGRDEANDIVIADPEVSRHHACLRRSGETFIVEDLGSTNGTFVNSRQVTAPMQLESGSKIRLGPFVTLVFEEITVGDAANSPTEIRTKSTPGSALVSAGAERSPTHVANPNYKWILWAAAIVLALAVIAAATAIILR